MFVPALTVVHLAGIPVRDELIFEIARMVDDAVLADRLEDAATAARSKVMALDVAEWESILRALDDSPAGARGAPRSPASRDRLAPA